MKKFLKNLHRRISDALKLLFCREYRLYMFYKDMPDRTIEFNVAQKASEQLLNLVLDDDKSILARRQIVEIALRPETSFITLFKLYGSCYVAYDCQSQADFDELLNQEIK